MSKGSRQRPYDHKAFADNYDRIFGKPRKPLVLTDSQEAALQRMADNATDIGLYGDELADKKQNIVAVLNKHVNKAIEETYEKEQACRSAENEDRPNEVGSA